MQRWFKKAIFYVVQKKKWTEIKIGNNLGRKWDFIKGSVEEGSVYGIELEVKPRKADVENEMWVSWWGEREGRGWEIRSQW